MVRSTDRRRLLLLIAICCSLLLGGTHAALSQSDADIQEITVLNVDSADSMEVVVGSFPPEGGALYGVDAPNESVGNCYAEEAKAFVAEKIGDTSGRGKSVTVWAQVKGQTSQDTLIEIFLDEAGTESLNRMLVETGHAVTLTPDYESEQQAAREAGRGLWGNCFPETSELAIAELAYEGSDDEVVTIVNQSDSAVNVDDWFVMSEPEQFCTFPDLTLEPGQRLRAHSGGEASAESDLDIVCSDSELWHDEGDAAWLINPERQYADRLEYGGGYRIGRQ